MNFHVEPFYLSPEHARQVERFTGCPYDAEESARLRAWARFRHWHWQLLRERDSNQTAARAQVGGDRGADAVGAERKTATIIPLLPRVARSDR